MRVGKVRGGYPGAKTWLAMVRQRTSEQIVESSKVWASDDQQMSAGVPGRKSIKDQPGGLRTLISKPSFENSFRA
jgi:hypothetical protein